MDISTIIPHIEALIFASEKPLTSLELTELINNAFGFMEDKINLDQVESAIEGIIEKYAADFYPFEMRQSGGGWQFLTKKDYHKTVAQLNGEKFLKRLSAASLETLAIIAYKQPITKGEVESIRGVNSDYSIQKLLEKELIVITGRNEELPGKPLVYTTSKSFMDYFGINSPDELPKIKEVFTDMGIEATVVNGIEETAPGNEPQAAGLIIADEEEGQLVVRGNGELIEEPPVVVDEDTTPVDPAVLETSREDDIVDQEVNQPYEAEINDENEADSIEPVNNYDDIGIDEGSASGSLEIEVINDSRDNLNLPFESDSNNVGTVEDDIEDEDLTEDNSSSMQEETENDDDAYAGEEEVFTADQEDDMDEQIAEDQPIITGDDTAANKDFTVDDDDHSSKQEDDADKKD